MKKILVIDDELYLQNNFITLALSPKLYQVKIVSNIDAEDKICDYDLIILDLLLPDSSGFIDNVGLEIIKIIRGKCKNIQILVFTSTTNAAIQALAIKYGADDLIEKYPSTLDFNKVVNSLLTSATNRNI
jgi:two-component system, NtrC family, response regulator HydG